MRLSVYHLVGRILFLFAAILAVPLAAQSGNQSEKKNEILEGEITVTGEGRRVRRKRAVTRTLVVGRKEIEATGAANAAQALEHTPGVEVRMGIRGIFLRLMGMDTKHVLVLVDGQRIAGRTNDALDLTRIKAEEIERIEIVKGAISALYGSEAIGGVVNIITRKVKRPVDIQTDMRYGSGRRRHFGTGGEASASALLGVNKANLYSSFVLGWHRSDGYDLSPFTETDRRNTTLFPNFPGYDADADILKQGTTGNSFRDLNVGNSTRWLITPTLELFGGMNYRYLDQERVDSTPPRRLSDRRNETHDGSFSLGAVWQLRRNLRARLTYGYSRFLDDLTQDQRGSDELDSKETQDERTQEARLQVDYRLNKAHLISVGAAFLYEELISPRLRARYAIRQRPAVFAQNEWRIGKWKILPGLRFEEDSEFGGQTSPRLQVYYRPVRELQIRAGAGAGFRAPSFKDLFFDFQNPGVGYQVVGNPNLQPERSRTYNADLDWQPGPGWNIHVGAFYNSLTNLIDFTLLPERRNDLSVFQPTNIRRAYTRGGQVMLDYRLNKHLTMGVGYAHTDTRDLEFDIPLEGRARHRGTYRVRWRLKKFSFSLTGSVYGESAFRQQAVPLYTLQSTGALTFDSQAPLTAFVQNRRLIFFENDPITPQQGVTYHNPFHLVNVRVSFKVGKLYELFAGVDNALDEYNERFNPMRPRFFYAGFRTRYRAPRVRPADRLRPEMERGKRLDEILRRRGSREF